MRSNLFLSLAWGYLSTVAETRSLDKRINNGLGVTPALGWNSWVYRPLLASDLIGTNS